ncbi:MAG: UDP-glucuronate decarboxylase [Candidatus Curtissbacteria bacterium GW2011_GWA1_40_47]|uniref:NAD-dependent epimerase/dehydratase domain-containing protein n=1 Tax=Candidatus Curtissbacteria bacterium RIFOXYA1_FULL_41_14 TaxID=1797737 RepID=A0A1F5HAU7_9BACT|nr:MAG: UDP-glucuronate decarboxylase [Candidatus Curtissbacteria bacterium GW2011_GWB1_40_28]KKR62375.1 MAG: NAD-dependent epimerase/dehydratase, dTDP-glucose 4,6-dehydratase [Microgenomates group bacterium GW2011_GWC1_40_35]KKR66424.1 MAG: UDP-glucuronate decarboxylase [Candidatus Curtissbacteria bacterium GW2011_GWA1_40_47]KKR77916.1 MAG: UDP-glucuronate decarboxylase [Candidatus Curtissbacteria bacterium GW2011_GWD1_40_8]KKS02543.1 MAG: UDP-glucuronate decarboxylase [Candidatus Curtissbacte
MKIILVTGGAGFIGSHLCERLVARGDTVICLDNLLTGSQKNIAHLMSKRNFFFFNHDVTKPFVSRKFAKIDEIYHLASPADPNVNSPFSYMAHPFETMKVNTIGTWNMCEIAYKFKAKLSFASTSEIYGDPEVSPQSENYRGNVSTIGPRSVYDESKRFGETIVAAFVSKKDLEGRITRIFNTYGPRMNVNEGRAVVNFIKQALTQKPITIFGDGKQTRSFCYIDDQVEGQILAMEKGKPGEVFNIGNDDERTILEFAKIIKQMTRSQSKITFSQRLPEDDPHQRRPDINKAKKVLQWKPKTSLEEGLFKTINYFKEIL